MGDIILEEYNHYLKRLDKAIAYNNKQPIEEGSKEHQALMNIISRLAELEKDIKEN